MIRVETPKADHFRDSAPNMEKYKAVRIIFLVGNIEIRTAIFFGSFCP